MSLLTNLVAYWKLDESSGNAADATGNGWTLTNTNTVSYNAGKINNGADGGSSNSNKFLTRADSLGLDGNSAVSIAGWINVTTAPSGTDAEAVCYYLLKGSNSSVGFIFQIEYRNVSSVPTLHIVRIGSAGQILQVAQTLTPGTWYQYAMTYNPSGNLTMYLNGSSIGSQAASSGAGDVSANPSTSNLLMGRIATENPFKGHVDEVGVWSRELSSMEISQLYNGGAGLAYPLTVVSNSGFFFNML